MVLANAMTMPFDHVPGNFIPQLNSIGMDRYLKRLSTCMSTGEARIDCPEDAGLLLLSNNVGVNAMYDVI